MPAPPAVPDVPSQLFLGGRWCPASDGETFDVYDPATGERLARVASASEADGRLALDRAADALPGWAARTPRARAEILRRAFELMTAQQEALARLITRENGKALADARSEVAYAAEFFRWYAEEAPRNIGEISRSPTTGARIVVQHRPAGIAVLVTPWNFPAAMATRKIAPALAAGCPVIVKPASETPLTMLALMPLLQEAGVPDGVISVLPSRRSGPLVSALVHDPRTRVLSFTGSTEVGRTLLKVAADTVVTPAMELGGNAPFVVFEDADLDAAVAGAMVAKMRNIGEACTAANRFYVHERVHDAFASRLAAQMAALRIGHGLDDGVEVGSLVNAETRDKVVELVADAVARGARVLTGGAPVEGPGCFYRPTVLVDVPDSARCFHEEIFGPVAALARFSDERDVLARCNGTEYGLVAYVYTRDLARGLAFSERLEFGMVGLNRGLVSDPAAVFGGMKQSGIGREGAHEGLLEFLETQYIAVEW
ncbi:MAG: NAD-dependent succinate-semialdehyde dehydrogenase [Vicinamibacterales bacterium]